MCNMQGFNIYHKINDYKSLTNHTQPNHIHLRPFLLQPLLTLTKGQSSLTPQPIWLLATKSKKIYTLAWKWKSLSRPTLCDPMDYTVQGILQVRILEWVAFPFSRGSSQPRDQAQVSHIAGGFFTSWATREDHTLAEALLIFMDANPWLKSDLTNILTSEKSQNHTEMTSLRCIRQVQTY